MIQWPISETGYRMALDRHRRLVAALDAAGALDLIEWRDLTLFDLTKCPHEGMHTVVYVENDLGAWAVDICAQCGEQVDKECVHKHNTWHLDGKVLTCNLCGIDGT